MFKNYRSSVFIALFGHYPAKHLSSTMGNILPFWQKLPSLREVINFNISLTKKAKLWQMSELFFLQLFIPTIQFIIPTKRRFVQTAPHAKYHLHSG